MRNKKGSVATTILLIIIFLLLLGIIYIYYKNYFVKEELKDFMKFQMEYSLYITEKCELNYTEELNNFLEYKMNEILLEGVLIETSNETTRNDKNKKPAS